MDTFDYNWNLVVEKLMKMGASKQQTESKIAKIVFQLCANDEEVSKLFKEKDLLNKIKKEEEEKVRNVEYLVNKISRLHKDIDRAQKKYSEIVDKLSELPSMDEINEYLITQKYIDDFNKELKNQETKEARDKLRTAQLFMNTVEVKTPQNNTYFIGGLASILSGVEFTKIPKLEKVEKTKPKFDDEAICL
ncbi:MAG TPA: hypothetical protein DCQ45_06645 [Erysipelotrichaceae bacterium]|nr:hypothetical protein [Erysipelotrichaceae bacterium]